MVALNIFDVGIEEYVQQQWVQQLTRQIWKQLVTFSDSWLVILFGLICSIFVEIQTTRFRFGCLVCYFSGGGFCIFAEQIFRPKKEERLSWKNQSQVPDKKRKERKNDPAQPIDIDRKKKRTRCTHISRLTRTPFRVSDTIRVPGEYQSVTFPFLLGVQQVDVYICATHHCITSLVQFFSSCGLLTDRRFNPNARLIFPHAHTQLCLHLLLFYFIFEIISVEKTNEIFSN